MNNFLSDLWNDLREKRLWPVAVLLLAGLVAIPVVLMKPAEEPAPAAPAQTQAQSEPKPEGIPGLETVKLDEGDLGSGSSLDTFDSGDPFRPPENVVKETQQPGATAGPGDVAVLVPGTGAGGGGGGIPVPTDTGGTDTGGTVDPSPDTGTGGDEPKTETTQYAYVIDVTFTANGRTRKVKGMQKTEMLPSAASPLLLFLGVSANGGNAVFLVDSTLDTAGEGSCKPSGDDCAFLHIGPGSEHEFANQEGDSYQLRIDQIRRVEVGAKPSAGSSKTKRASAKPAVGASAAPRRFMPPLLADLVSVSTTPAGDSDTDQDRR
jgi:hypothetical protein